MAKDWIKMRPGMAGHAKVTAMSRVLLSHRGFRVWFLGEDVDATPCGVTNTVTFSIVTRVTVAALLDVWGAINHVVKGDNRVSFMAPEDIDQIAGVPGFADAMRAVDWLLIDDDGALIFPNFQEFNTPEAERPKAKTSAERKRDQRERDKAKADNGSASADVTNVTPCHEMSREVEESREEQTLPDAGARESRPEPQAPPDPEVEAAVAADQQPDRAMPADADKALRFGEIVTVLDSHGIPYHWTTGAPGRDALLSWAEAGVTRADISEAFARAYQHKQRDGPIGPRYLDPIIRQVVNERLHPTPNNQRGNHARGKRRGGGTASAVRKALADD